MSFALLSKYRKSSALAFLIFGLLCVALFSPRLTESHAQAEQAPKVAFGAGYAQTNLVSDLPGVALVEDRKLVNPWGIAVGQNTPFWVISNKTDRANLYKGDYGAPLSFNPNPPYIQIPNIPTLVATPSLPTGIAFNPGNDFQVPFNGLPPVAAPFIAVTENGGINANTPNFGGQSLVMRFLVGHRYTGVAIGYGGSGSRLFAVDFANGKIDVFDGNFNDSSVSGNFADATIPANFHPFNIVRVDDVLYVTYAQFQSAMNNDLGFVRKFDLNGVRDMGFAINNGPLADPYGVALAPDIFGFFSNMLLVGNYRSLGTHQPSINAFNPTTGAFVGGILDGLGDPIEIKDLRGLTFGNGTLNAGGGNNYTLYFVAGIPNQQFQIPHGLFGSLNPLSGPPATTIQFSAAEYNTSEAIGHFDVTVTRMGDLSSTSMVNYATTDSYATQKSEYEIALGRLVFNPGETSKTFRVLIVDNNQGAAGTRHDLNLVLSNPVNAALVTPNQAKLFIMDNELDSEGSPPNIIDSTQFFVRQQYFDFLNREPDAAGLDFWTNQILSCGSDQACIELKRINVSAAFFLSIEFQRTGLLAYLTEKAAFGGLPRYGQFMRDVQALQRDYVFGAPLSEAQLEANKQAFFNEFVTRPEFSAKYSGLTNENFVSALFANAGLNTTTGELYIAALDGTQTVPPTNSTARGLVIFRNGRTNPNLFVTLYLNGLSSAQTEAHIHGPAAADANGPVIVTLPNGQLINYQTTLTNPQFLDLGAGRVYVDVHTTNFPNGEIRAQMPFSRFVTDMLSRALNSGIITRAQALRLIVESEYLDGEKNRSFVLMEYFGYLRRNPDDPPDSNLNGYNFWLNKLNEFNGNFVNADMVKAFLKSTEYRQRFGPP